jgi:hypothetical protein
MLYSGYTLQAGDGGPAQTHPYLSASSPRAVAGAAARKHGFARGA